MQAIIDYDHRQNLHTPEGARCALPLILNGWTPKSLLDVGCGPGNWLKAAEELGIRDYFGLDGVQLEPGALKVPAECFRQEDLTGIWTLKRTFDLVICLEVAEHLPPACSQTLVQCLVAHGKTICFSAACPGQPGQHHVNCRWPRFWQELFNKVGYVCDDSVRWRAWENKGIEPWYRQNMFLAHYDPQAAGKEAPIQAVVHPDMLSQFMVESAYQERTKVEEGRFGLAWYCAVSLKAMLAKLGRSFKR